jgi:hypothetical protein
MRACCDLLSMTLQPSVLVGALLQLLSISVMAVFEMHLTAVATD